MALTIALITATYCLTLCACARLMTERVSANSKVALVLQRVAGLFLVGFGLRMIR